MSIYVTHHAVARYQERIENIGEDKIIAILSCPAVEMANRFGCKTVILPNGARAILDQGSVVTVLAKGMKRSLKQ